MATKNDLQDWLVDALKAHDGSGKIIQLCKHIWKNHEESLRASGDLFYTWQYDVRWAAYQLRKNGKMMSASTSPKGIWKLA
jgi:hypothetical protein